MYNFNSARSGGDVIDGNDIGKLKLPKAFVPAHDNEGQSDVSIALDGSTYPGRKMTRFSSGQKKFDLRKRQQAITRYRRCHLQLMEPH